jgi:hypothetical protein
LATPNYGYEKRQKELAKKKKKEEKLKSKTERKQFGDSPESEGGDTESDTPASGAPGSEST